MVSVLRDLEAIRDENLQLLAVTDNDIGEIKKWGEQRELIFARLRAASLQLSTQERAIATSLVKEIVEQDAVICARLQQHQANLSRKRAVAAKMRQALTASEGCHSFVLLRRVA